MGRSERDASAQATSLAPHLRRVRTYGLGLAATLAAAALLAAPSTALAGYYDYLLYAPYQTWSSRGVSHDYSYLQSEFNSTALLCLQRNVTGTVFCANAFVDHHYADSCNPSSCFSWYWQQVNPPRTIYLDIHDEWR